MTPPAASVKTHAADLCFHLRHAERSAFSAEAEAPTAATHDQARQLREGIARLRQRAAELEEGMKHRNEPR